MQHFFKSVGFNPSTYITRRDGAAVGLYTPAYTHVHPETKHVTKDRFMDTRLPENRTDPLFKPIIYPKCTSQGRAFCDLASRAATRGGRSHLTEKQAKYLKLI